MNKPPLQGMGRGWVSPRVYIAAMALLPGFQLLAQPVQPTTADVDIYFYGYVHPYIPPPCTFNVDKNGRVNNNSSGSVVVLPRVGIKALRDAGSRVWGADVRFSSRGCTGLYVDNMWVYFSAGNVDAEGRVMPGGGSGALRFELVDMDSGNRIEVGKGGTNTVPDVSYQGTAAQFQGSIMTNQIREAEKYYQIYYYTPTGLTLADVGEYSVTMTANFVYY